MSKDESAFKGKVLKDLVEYGFNVIYLTIAFGTFTAYRRLLLAAHDIDYTDYGIAFIEALILAKVIMIGSVFRLRRGLEDKPLIIPTTYKTVVFVRWFLHSLGHEQPYRRSKIR